MSQISLPNSPEQELAGSEAKNPLPVRTKGMAAIDVAGLGWIFSEDPLDYA